MAKATEATLTPEQSQKLLEWTELDRQLSEVKAKEMALRVELVTQLTSTAKLEGSQTLTIGNGWKLRAKKSQNYTLTNKQGEAAAVQQKLADEGRADVAAALITWKPDMSLTTYKNVLLPLVPTIPGLDKLLAAALTIKPGAPELELVPPEEAK